MNCVNSHNDSSRRHHKQCCGGGGGGGGGAAAAAAAAATTVLQDFSNELSDLLTWQMITTSKQSNNYSRKNRHKNSKANYKP